MVQIRVRKGDDDMLVATLSGSPPGRDLDQSLLTDQSLRPRPLWSRLQQARLAKDHKQNEGTFLACLLPKKPKKQKTPENPFLMFITLFAWQQNVQGVLQVTKRHYELTKPGLGHTFDFLT